MAYDHSRGKPEAWVVLDTPEDGYIEFGHHASSREEFARWTEERAWDKLLKYLNAKKDWYIDIPAGTLHAIGKGVLIYNISRNADCTYRLYDYDRIDPKSGKHRPLHAQKVIDNVNTPDNTVGFVWFEPTLEQGCQVTRYWDEPGLYTLLRLKVQGEGRYEQERFSFYTVYEGAGTLNGHPLKKGDTVLVPHGYGPCVLKGDLDIFVASYRDIV